MIRAEGLTKVFGSGGREVCAVDALDLNVSEGEVFGFLGPNGAGKTTTVRMLTTLVGATSGFAWVNGIQVGKGKDADIRANVGVLTEAPGLYDRLSAERNLLVFAELYGCTNPRDRVAKYLKLLGLWDRRDSEAGTFSKGMRQKLAIARAFLHEPPLVFLDEPTSGVDPITRRQFWEMIYEAARGGTSVLVTTHYMDEAEYCDRVSIMVAGRIAALGSPVELEREHGVKTIDELFVRLARPDGARAAAS